MVLLLLCATTSARAQGAGATDAHATEAQAPQAQASETVGHRDADTARRAREEFEAGVRHFQAREYREAIHSFQVAAELVPSADLWFNIARSYEELGEYEPAIEHYRRYLRDRVDPPDRAQVEAHIAELAERAEAARAAAVTTPTTGTLRLRASDAGGAITIDGRAVGTTPIDTEIELEPGSHELRVTREGSLPFVAQPLVEAGVRTDAVITLLPATQFRAIQADRIWTWVSFGLAAAALGVSIGLGVEAGSRQSDLASAREWSAWSDAALGGAIGFTALGLVLFFVEGRTVRTEVIHGDGSEDDGAVVGAGAVRTEADGAPVTSP